MLLKGEVNNVTLQNSQTSKSSDYSNKSVNIINLINKLKFHETKQKRQTLLVKIAAFSVLAISGLVVSL